jgi:hypothetical protein
MINPTLVARTASLRWPPASARPTNSSLVYGPYASAVSISVIPSSRARWITAIDVASSRAVSRSYDAVMPMQPRPMIPTSGPALPSVVVCMRFIVPVGAMCRGGRASTEAVDLRRLMPRRRRVHPTQDTPWVSDESRFTALTPRRS